MAQVYAGIDYSRLDIRSRVDGINSRLDTLNTRIDAELFQKIRYGRLLALLEWFYGSKITAPTAGSTLFSYTVSSNRRAYIYGFYIYASEGNTFEIRWSYTPPGATSPVTYDYPILFTGAGTLHAEFTVAINEGKPADPSSVIEIININTGSANSVYKAGLLIGET